MERKKRQKLENMVGMDEILSAFINKYQSYRRIYGWESLLLCYCPIAREEGFSRQQVKEYTRNMLTRIQSKKRAKVCKESTQVSVPAPEPIDTNTNPVRASLGTSLVYGRGLGYLEDVLNDAT
jgi:hypothetical protein